MSAFKECDIRGAYGTEVTDELAYRLGRAVATVLPGQEVLVAGDFRLSTPQLMEQLSLGLVEGGARVVEVGQVSTPCYYFARRRLGVRAGVMVTASHSPPDCNGFKPILGALPVTPEDIRLLGGIVASGEFGAGGPTGVRTRPDVKPQYVAWLAGRFEDLAYDCPRMVLDCGHGATGWAVDDLIAALRLPATVLFGRPDGRFPERSPDIAGPDDLLALQAETRRQGAVFGAGFDGDGDRVGFVDESGSRVSSDLLVACLAREALRHDSLVRTGPADASATGSRGVACGSSGGCEASGPDPSSACRAMPLPADTLGRQHGDGPYVGGAARQRQQEALEARPGVWCDGVGSRSQQLWGCMEPQPVGAVVCDVKLSKAVSEMVQALGGAVVVEKSGHTFIKRAMIERRALLGGEFSGHLFFRELAGDDDGLFAALLVASLISASGRTLSQLFTGIPRYYSSRDIRIRSHHDRDTVIGKAAEHAMRQGARLVLVDGVKAEYPEGWALVRASVTESAFTFRFEGNTRDDMVSVAESFLGGLGELGERARLELERDMR